MKEEKNGGPYKYSMVCVCVCVLDDGADSAEGLVIRIFNQHLCVLLWAEEKRKIRYIYLLFTSFMLIFLLLLN